jgi:hypothetical protein
VLIPGRHDTTIVKGASWDFRVQWLVTEAETPVDLSSWSGQLNIKPRSQASDPILVCSTENGSLTLDDEGNVRARLTKEQVNSLPVGTLFYEVELSSAEESVQLLAGRVKVEP